MPEVLNRIFSFTEMKEKWDEDNPNEPYERLGSAPAWYDLTDWIIRVDNEGKTISTTGWSEHPDYVVVGGTKSIKDSPKGHMTDLVPYRTKVLPDKPLLATFSPAPRWVQANENAGWQITNIEPSVLNLIPKNILTKVKEYAKAKGVPWGIKPANRIEKAWHLVLRRGVF